MKMTEKEVSKIEKPNMIIMSPSDEAECWKMLNTGYNYDGPAAIRYPRGEGSGAEISKNLDCLEIGKAKVINDVDSEIVIFSFGNVLDLALDISDELKRVIQMMKPHADKVRVVLNKADSISTQQLMRVYGALMWQLGKVMNTPEVCRVYIGSFWGAPLKNTDQATLLNREKLDLFSDIAQLPQNAVMRRINELVKRARGVKIHAYIIHYLRKQLPYTFGKKEKQAEKQDNLVSALEGVAGKLMQAIEVSFLYKIILMLQSCNYS